jgi:hypothetical protein
MEVFMKRVSFISCTLLLVCSSVFAQSIPTATLSGKVTADGAALPGVTVTVRSPQLQGTRSTESNPSGDYILPLLPPGEYTVTFELSGMQSRTRKATLTAARTEVVDMELKPSAVAESITVTAETPITAAIESTQVTTNFKQDMVEKLPVLRNLENVTLLAPGVVPGGPNGNIMVSGAMSFDTLYLVNGAIVNENLRGQPHGVYIEDALQETTVMTGAISAEYGHFTGGVVSAITKSGGNELKGSVRDNLSNESWNGKTPFTAEQEDKINNVYEGTIGGPFLRDRLWFFGAGRVSETSDIAQTTPGLARAGDQDANGVAYNVGDQLPPLTYPHSREQTRLEGKLTLSMAAKHTVVGSYLDVEDTETNQRFTAAIMDLQSLVPARKTPNSLMSLNYTGVLTNKFFVEGQYAKKEFAFLGGGSRFTDNIRGTLMQDRARGTRWWTPTFRNTPEGERRDHELYTAKATYFLSTPSFGTHELKAGYEHFFEVRAVNNYQQGSDYRISVASSIVRGQQTFGRFLNTGSNTRISYLPILVLSQGSEYSVDSAFLNDRWTLNDHWSFNIGLRFDKNDAMSGDHSFKVADDQALSPRVAANYDLFGNGRLIANASYGQYVGRLAEGVGNDGDPAGRNASFAWDYRGPAMNTNVNAPTSELIPTDAALQALFDWFFANGGTNRRPFRSPPSVPGVESILDPNGLKSPNVKEYTLGLGGTIGNRGFARADLILRNWDDFYVSFVDKSTGRVSDEFGTTYDQAIVRNDSDIYDREYTAVQTQFSYRIFQGLNIGGTYTWSRLVGNVIGEDSGSGPVVGVSTERPEYRQESWNYPTGYLPGDVRNRAKVWVSFDQPTPFGDFNISLLQNFDSGNRTSVDGTIDPSPFKDEGYVEEPTGISYFFGGRGSLKTDNIFRTDLAINYKVALFRGFELFVQPEVINIFNAQGVEAFDEEVLTNSDEDYLKPFNPFTETPIECPQGAPAATCESMGAHWQKGPNFGKPDSESDYQQSRTFRFSVGLRF